MQQDPEISQGRRPKNPAEAEFFDSAASDGWLLTKRGWPDFFLKRGNQVCCVEVKPASSRALRREQARVMAALITAGIPCFVWSPDGGLQRVSLGERGLQFVSSFGETKAVLDALGGESEGNQVAAGQLVPIEGGEPEPAAGPVPTSPSQSETAAQIDEVGAAYIATMNPRSKDLADDERIIIRNALRVATAEELIICIVTCEASDYHMKRGIYAKGAAKERQGGKYNSLGKILKPRPRREETQRSRIEWWLDRADSSGVAGFPSADAAIVSQRQVEVQRGHQSGDPEMVKKAKDAEAWLADHGIETVRRRTDGFPTFKRIGSDSE